MTEERGILNRPTPRWVIRGARLTAGVMGVALGVEYTIPLGLGLEIVWGAIMGVASWLAFGMWVSIYFDVFGQRGKTGR